MQASYQDPSLFLKRREVSVQATFSHCSKKKENHAAIKEVMIAIRRRFLFLSTMYRLYINSPNMNASSPCRLTLYHSRITTIQYE